MAQEPLNLPLPHPHTHTPPTPFHIQGIKEGVKGKAIPLQAWTGPEGTRRLSLPDFKTVGT